MTTADMLAALSESPADARAEDQATAPYTRPDETHLHAPDAPCGVRCRNDGVVEIYTGETMIVLDPATGSVVLAGTHVLIQAKDANATAETFAVSGRPLNAHWLPDAAGPAAEQRALAARAEGGLDRCYVYPRPVHAEGEAGVPLSEFLAAHALFGARQDLTSLNAHLGALLGRLP